MRVLSVKKMNREVSVTRRSFKQTSFCDKGPGYSNEANTPYDYCCIRRGYLSSHCRAKNLNSCE